MIIHDFLYDLFGNQFLSILIASALPLLFCILPFVLYAVYGERKISAFLQDRLGPMRTGYYGLLQTVADLVKLLQKEDIVAKDTDKKLFNLAPVIVFTGTYAAFAVVPFTSAYVGADLDVGIFYIVAVTGFVVAGILMAGWASNNKYSLLGAIRSAAQIISYEIPTVLVILTIVMILGTMNLTTISEVQTSYFWNWMILGGPEPGLAKFALIPFMVLGFIILYISSLAEVNRTPFDIPEAESELVSGFHTEYSGMKFAMYFLSEYANMFLVSIVVSILFFGGYQSPFGYLGNTLGAEWLIPIEQIFWFSTKGVFFVMVQMWLRWTLPRLRVDQLMTVCWKFLIPFAFVNLLIVGLITVL